MAWAKPDDASVETEGVESVRGRVPPCPDQRSLCIGLLGRRDIVGTSQSSSETQLYPHVST